MGGGGGGWVSCWDGKVEFDITGVSGEVFEYGSWWWLGKGAKVFFTYLMSYVLIWGDDLGCC